MASSTSVSSCCHFVLFCCVFSRHSFFNVFATPNAHTFYVRYVVFAFYRICLRSHRQCFKSRKSNESKFGENVIYTCFRVVTRAVFAGGFSFWFINFDRYACNSLSIESVDWPQLSNKLLRRWQRFFLFIDGANFIVDFVQSNKHFLLGIELVSRLGHCVLCLAIFMFFWVMLLWYWFRWSFYTLSLYTMLSNTILSIISIQYSTALYPIVSLK